MTNLSRFIKINKCKPAPWKINHPYVLIDRYELETGDQYKKEDNCHVAFYGYIRGCSYRITPSVLNIIFIDFYLDTYCGPRGL